MYGKNAVSDANLLIDCTAPKTTDFLGGALLFLDKTLCVGLR